MVVAQPGIVNNKQWHWRACLLGGLFLFSSVGCGPNEEITKTTEPRDDFGKRLPVKNAFPPSATVPKRMLAVIAPATERESWFFKLMGPIETVAQQEAAFDAFLASLQFSEQKDKPVTWVLPEGWHEGPKKEGRYATILTGPEDDAIELTVSSAGGGVLGNVNRWRGQVGLEPIAEDALNTVCRDVDTKQGKKVMRVDLIGKARAAPSTPKIANAKISTRLLAIIAPGADGESWFFKLMGPAEIVSKQEAAFDAFALTIRLTDDKDKPVAWTLPEAWREGPRKEIRYATILPCPENPTIELTVMPARGSLLDNVNRWRGQVGLEPVAQDALNTVCREIETKQGKKVMRVDLTGNAAKGPVMPPFMNGR